MKNITVFFASLMLLFIRYTAAYYPCKDIGDTTAVYCDKGTCPGTAICDKSFDVCCCGKTKLNCIVEPCRFASCPNFPGAKCIDEFCEGCCCVPRFIIPHTGKEVTDKCHWLSKSHYCDHDCICSYSCNVQAYTNIMCINAYKYKFAKQLIFIFVSIHVHQYVWLYLATYST